MAQGELLDPEAPQGEEPEAPDSPAGYQGSAKIRRPFSKLAVELNDDDLESKGVQKLLLGEIARLEAENAELRSFRSDYHIKDKDCARFEVRLQQ